MKSLEQLRAEIDAIDEQLIVLLSARFSASEAVALEKMQIGKGIYDGDRERMILDKIRILSREKNFSPALAERIFEFLFHESRRAQETKMHERELSL